MRQHRLAGTQGAASRWVPALAPLGRDDTFDRVELTATCS